MKKAWYVYSLGPALDTFVGIYGFFASSKKYFIRVNNPTDPADEEVIEDDSEERR